MKDYLEAGRLVTTHGVRGELKAEVWCDSFDFFAGFKIFYLDSQGKRSVKVKSVRPQGNMALLVLDGVNDMDAARALIGKTLYFARSDAKLPEESHFIADLIGCRVLDAHTGKCYGTVKEIRQGAQDIYTVEGENGQLYYFPAVPEFLKEANPEEGRVIVAPIPGMFEDAVNGDED